MSYNENKELCANYKAASGNLNFRRFSEDEIVDRGIRKEREAIERAKLDPRVIAGKCDPYIVGNVEYMIG